MEPPAQQADQTPAQQSGDRRAPAPASESDALGFNLEDVGGEPSLPAQQPETAAQTPEEASGATETTQDFSDFQLDLDNQTGDAASPASDQGDAGMLNIGDELLEQPSGNLDPAEQPFPAPDQQTDLDRELDRLASERDTITANVSGESAPGQSNGGGQESSQGVSTQDLSWETAESGSEALDLPDGGDSEIEFDLNLDDSSFQQSAGEGSPETAGEQQTAASGSSTVDQDVGEGLLEFESDNIPPQETWAGPSTDAAPGSEDENIAFSPDGDVQSAGAPPYNEAETKLDLARAYLDMGDKVGARSIIDEVMREGDPAQRDRAAELAAQL